jgi:DNA-binding NtrC family response regulator
MNGADALREIRARTVTTPAILTSGFSAVDIGAELARDPFTTFLRKPYEFEELSELIRRMLGGHATTHSSP